MVSSFCVSPSIWDKWLIERKAKEIGITILKEMGVITSYRFTVISSQCPIIPALLLCTNST